ncbi:hypothetical protein BP422_12085 [Brevibacillus formosus]|uniref:Uncharacterized protein n=1 Tax=Brevibacillus formosus TaxID=54913 RepID=A0A220MGP4_9BACL|nr:hypothetical protein [Brevibacillus formosus]ASJ54221.1 hypothetical protein BP422_12085 [Brevibacillus formosus]
MESARARVPYWQEEVEAIDSMYDDQTPVSVIVEEVNKTFHEGNQVRNKNSVHYVIRKLYHGDNPDWKELLPMKWPGN